MLKEIRKQPEHIRALFMWISVLITFSLVVFVWAISFQDKLAFLLTPSEQETAAATNQESPFKMLGKSLGDLKIALGNLFGLFTGTKEGPEVIKNVEETFGIKIEPRLLPLSEDKEK